MRKTVLITGGTRGRGKATAIKFAEKNYNIIINYFKNDKISIWRSAEFVNNQARLKNKPKTENSIRTIPIIGLLHNPLNDYCRNMKQDDFIFGQDKPLSETAIKSRAYSRIVSQPGFSPKRSR